MTERRIQPVLAEVFHDFEDFRDRGMRTPGAVCLRGERLWCTCPCGCGGQGALRVGLNVKPKESPSWALAGEPHAPTLDPSVHHVGHWHGWLRQGVWTSV